MTKTIIACIVCLFAMLFATTPAFADTTPTFGYMAPGWVNPPAQIQMAQFWAPQGLQETGVNYYSSGAPNPNSSTWERFDPQSELFQAWFGVYVVNSFAAASEWTGATPTSTSQIPATIQRVLTLTAADQAAWLFGYGDPAPLANVSNVIVRPLGHGWFGLEATMASHVDIGVNTPAFGFNATFASVSSEISSYQPVTLHFIEAFTYDTTAQEAYVKYSAGAEWTTLDGACHAAGLDVYAEELFMMAATRL